MKYVTFLITLLLISCTKMEERVGIAHLIVDNTFREYCLNHFDYDNNSILTVEELLRVKEIIITEDTFEEDNYIYTLEGISLFRNLNTLICEYQKLKQVDVSTIKPLKKLYLKGNYSLNMIYLSWDYHKYIDWEIDDFAHFNDLHIHYQ